MVFTTFVSGLTAMNEEDVDGWNRERVNGDCTHEIKKFLLLGRKVITNLDSILKRRHYFVNKGLTSEGHGFSSGHV